MILACHEKVAATCHAERERRMTRQRAFFTACHPNTTITSIFVVNDSGWLYPATGEQVILDNVTVNNLVATGPGNNN